MKAMILAISLAAAGGAMAGPAQDALRRENETLTAQLDTCAIIVQTIFVRIRANLPPDPANDISKCVADGKVQAKTSFEAIKATVGGKKATQELADWRIEWMTAFDAAAPQDSDIERLYLQRVSQSKGTVSRATNRLEAALD